MSYSSTLGRWMQQDPAGYVDGRSLYGFAHQSPVTWVDPAGLKSTPCVANGQPIVLTFDGSTLTSSSGESWRAVSGRPVSWDSRVVSQGGNMITVTRTTYTFDNSAARQGMSNVGPVPEGTYSIETSEQRNLWTSPWSHGALGRGWGAYSWSLHPDPGTETHGRSGVFIHGGDFPGSAGCIDLMANDVALAKLLENVRHQMSSGSGCNCSIQIIVKYPQNPNPVRVEVDIDDIGFGGP